MLLRKLKDILLADSRLTACQDEAVDAELLGLCDHLVHLLIGQVQLTAVLRCPAACAVKVTCGCRIEKDDPRNTAAILLRGFSCLLEACEAGLKAEAHEKPLQVVKINAVNQVVEELCPLAFFVEGRTKSVIGFRRPCVTEQLLNCIDDINISLLTVFDGLLTCRIKNELESLALCGMNQFVSHSKYPPD